MKKLNYPPTGSNVLAVMLRFSSIWIISVFLALGPAAARAGDYLLWNAKSNRVDADIQHWDIAKVLKKINGATGYRVYTEPGLEGKVSVKFKNLPEDEALRRLLGQVNFCRDESNGLARLFVFKTAQNAATKALAPAPAKNYRIPDELLVKLKPGSKESIDAMAKRLGAKILGRDDKLGLYRLQLADGAAANAAQQALVSDPSVDAVDGNYLVDRPIPAQLTAVGPAPAGPAFNLNPPSDNGRVVGLVDTAVNAPDQFQKYMLTPISVVGTPDPPSDEPSHGTAMLETMLAAMAANPSKILPVDVYGGGETTSTFDVMEGIVQAVNAGANPINLSLGGTGDSEMLGSLIQSAEQKGVQFVAASGNTPGAADTYPAAYPGVLAVTAAAPNGQLASYADDGTFVRAMEPGTSMVVWNGQQWVVQGTSPATATMTGAITQLMNAYGYSLAEAVSREVQIHPPPQ